MILIQGPLSKWTWQLSDVLITHKLPKSRFSAFQTSFQISKNSGSSYLIIYKDKYGTLVLFSLIDALCLSFHRSINSIMDKTWPDFSLENLLPQSPEHILLVCNMTSHSIILSAHISTHRSPTSPPGRKKLRYLRNLQAPLHVLVMGKLHVRRMTSFYYYHEGF